MSNERLYPRRLDEDERGTLNIFQGGRFVQHNGITESGFWSLVMRSNKPEAKAIKKWFTSEVMPSLRKTGRYEMPGAQRAEPATNPTLATRTNKHGPAPSRGRAGYPTRFFDD